VHLVGLFYVHNLLFIVHMYMFGSEWLPLFNIIQDSTQPAKIQNTTKTGHGDVLRTPHPMDPKYSLMHREHILSEPCIIQTTVTVQHSEWNQTTM